MRLYVSSRSYPELREVDAGPWRRGLIWLRAGRTALLDPAFLAFTAVAAGLVLGGLGIAASVGAVLVRVLPPALGLVLLPALGIVVLVPAMLLAVTVGGDVLRPHLRRACPAARDACPACGYGLARQLDAAEAATRAATEVAAGAAGTEADGAQSDGEAAVPIDPEVTCPECGARVPSSIRRPPHRIPRRFRAVGRP